MLKLNRKNILTQVILNAALNIVNYNFGSMSFTFSYVLYEILVSVIEAVTYAASFAFGLWLEHVIPGIF